MKKSIILVAAITMTAINLLAQNGKAINDRISQRLEEVFPAAQNVSWTSLPKKIRQARFSHSGHIWMAFFDGQGEIVATARKVKDIQSLPLQISEGLKRQKSRLEKKYGELTLAHTFEMVNNETTKYYSTFANPKVTVVISATTNGYCVVERKERKTIVNEIRPPKNVIAKKN